MIYLPKENLWLKNNWNDTFDYFLKLRHYRGMKRMYFEKNITDFINRNRKQIIFVFLQDFHLPTDNQILFY